MKKYVFMFLMCCPLMAFGAPSVRALGSNAISGAAVAKVTPAKSSAASVDRGSSVARVGSLRAKATTSAAPSTVTSSTSRFPVILPTKVYSTANAPRPTGVSTSSSTIVPSGEVDLSGINERVRQIENLESNNPIVNTVKDVSNLQGNTEIVNRVNQVSNLQGNTEIVNRVNQVSNLEGDTTVVTTVNELKDNADTILVHTGEGVPAGFTNRTDNRAWIWVEK